MNTGITANRTCNTDRCSMEKIQPILLERNIFDPTRMARKTRVMIIGVMFFIPTNIIETTGI